MLRKIYIILIFDFILTLSSCYKGNDYNYEPRYFASWSCQNNSSCINTLGYNQGSAGGFCSLNSCQNWVATNVSIYSSSQYTCSETATYTIYIFPKGNNICL
ncbi:hypothetical protein QEJ31_10105 [Pigmentibacter sp. JX0631]|uniref:hypothetical protein n=1 Tax=Pigmentibacter sp. JX0631 TaxID=2976982 RepID=UPI00246869D1|nr:hypothetical protein [Pigmentibacter sp. JX0631]WGL58874.1 hypothetical protein QEJ31_10105 [Pigmentibacter sp. JX0631]